MATYKEIQQYIHQKYGVSVKTCWIAHVKEHYGLTKGPAPNRRGERVEPCPSQYWGIIVEALEHFGMI